MKMGWIKKFAEVLLVVGGLNWGLAIFNFNLVTAIFGIGTIATNLVYGLVGASAIVKILEWMKVIK